jgi:hypothetical protein
VLAVAADWNAGQFRPTPGGPVLLAMERNEATAAAVATAYSLAETFHRTLLVLHARTPAEASAFLNPQARPRWRSLAFAAERFPVRCMVKDGNPATQLWKRLRSTIPACWWRREARQRYAGAAWNRFCLLARSRVPVLCVPPEPVRRSMDRSERLVPAGSPIAAKARESEQPGSYREMGRRPKAKPFINRISWDPFSIWI